MVIFEELFGCHEVLILGRSPIKWRQHSDLTIAVDWDVKRHFKQTIKNKTAYTMKSLSTCTFRKLGMILITVIMFLAAIFGGIPTVANSPECLIISRALVGLHCGEIYFNMVLYYMSHLVGKPTMWFPNRSDTNQPGQS